MAKTYNHDEKIAALTFAGVYPHYLKKVETKGRTQAELQEVIEWLTGFDQKKQQALLEEKVNFEQFFKKAT
jgi:hypothetical protein